MILFKPIFDLGCIILLVLFAKMSLKIMTDIYIICYTPPPPFPYWSCSSPCTPRLTPDGELLSLLAEN